MQTEDRIDKESEKGGLYRRFVKRLIDIVLSLFAIIILSPIILAAAVLIRVKLGSPVIFKQKRPGKAEKIFTLYKFRTMTDERDEKGVLLPDLERLTPFGLFLRKYSIDELPELFNILNGDMSIVGPRPLVVEYLPYYTPEEKKRHDVKPGLTGLAQISGRSFLKWEERFALDTRYVRDYSFALDCAIVLKTVKLVLMKQNVADDSTIHIDEKGLYVQHQGVVFRQLDVERREMNNA